MVFSVKDYYDTLNGESDITRDVWNVNYDKRHVFKVYSDREAIDEHVDDFILPPSSAETDLVNVFSNKLNQKIKNTKIVSNLDGTESVELELEDRLITVIVDNSGSQTWTDNGGFRYSIVRELVNSIESNYPGHIYYNLIAFGGALVNVLFFGLIEEDGIDTTDFDSVAKLILADNDANFAGIRVMRSTSNYPSDYGGLDGEEVDDGFISGAVDSALSEGTTYYYKVFTYDKNLKMSKGVGIKVTPKDRIIPRGISLFKTTVESTDLSTGSPYIGYGVNRDDNSVAIWHMGEGRGRNVYDFSDSNVILEHSKVVPAWIDERYTACGKSGIVFNGVDDYILGNDDDNRLDISFSGSDIYMTIMAWVYPYLNNGKMTIIQRGTDSNNNYLFGINENNKLFFVDPVSASVETYSLTVSDNSWQHVAFVRNNTNITFYINGVAETVSLALSSYSTLSNNVISIGSSIDGSYKFSGIITEVSIHDIDRSLSYINGQIVDDPIYGQSGAIVRVDKTGIKEDNGDRLVVFKYEIPADFNFAGGTVRIVRNDKQAPMWEEDGEIVYEESATAGIHYVSDPLDMVLSTTYYYRIFSRNSTGNFSFIDDSRCLSVSIPPATTDDYMVPLNSVMINPTSPPGSVPSIVAGNKKNYIRWSNPVAADDRIKRVKIFYSTGEDYPVVNKDGVSGSYLAYIAMSDSSYMDGPMAPETGFVHRTLSDGSPLVNGVTYRYTVVFIDKYGRSSGYSPDGSQNDGPGHLYPFYHVAATPSVDADESTIPLKEVNGLHYEIIDDDSINLKWDNSERNPNNIEAYFDQTVLLYASLSNELGLSIDSNTFTKMYIKADILRESQADNVFSNVAQVDFTDRDAYRFSVANGPDGIIKATLQMSDNPNIISQIKEATFSVQIKSYIPKEGGASTVTNSTEGNAVGSLEEYSKAINQVINEIEGTTTAQVASQNVFEYYSKTISIHYTNPWEIELVNRDNQKVSESCYVQEEDPLTKEKYLSEIEQKFNGVYMKASAPFVARAKLKYKGLPISSGSIDIAVWDADFSNLCRNAGAANSSPYEGEKISPSTLIIPPNNQMPVKNGYETKINSGVAEQVEISYVDIPLYAPSIPHAVRLFVKGSYAGYSSYKDLYILFHSILKISLQAETPTIDGNDVKEQRATAFIINPDYPNYKTNLYDASLITYPVDHSIVEWKITKVEGSTDRSLYSIDKVPRINGIFSYTHNGIAGNVFFGPIPIPSEALTETHEISAKIVYQGLVSEAKRYIYIEYSPSESKQFEAKFLMQIDGGYNTSGIWQEYEWLNVDGFPMWSDGVDYRKVKICSNPSVASANDFSEADCFRTCAEQHGLSLLKLGSNQIVQVVTGDSSIEIVHGEVSEETDPYTGEHYLRVGEDGIVDHGSAYIELQNQSISDTTYFYIRSHSFIPEAGAKAPNEDINSEYPINPCLCLHGDAGLFEDDIPRWSPVVYLMGSTPVFVNNRWFVLSGGGDFRTGLPPCPISLQEPLGIYTKWRKVIDYYYEVDNPSLQTTNPSVLLSQVTEVGHDDFLDVDGNSYIKYSSEIVIRVVVTWKGENVPDNTPAYVSIGNNSPTTIFIADRSVYYTSVDPDGGYSYADITIYARRSPSQSITESVEIFTLYDKEGTTSRRMGTNYSLTLDYTVSSTSDPAIVEPILPPPPPPPITVHSNTLERYNILTNEWGTASNMSESKGNMFVGVVDDMIYVMGGLKNNSLNISDKNERYNPSLDVWEDKLKMVTPRFGGMSISYDGKIYTIGGIFFNTQNRMLGVSNVVECYDASNNTWNVLSPISFSGEVENGVAFGTASLAMVNGEPYIYLMGGIRRIFVDRSMTYGQLYNEKILRYSINNNFWEYSNKLRDDELMHYQRVSPLSIVYDNRIIVFNGAIESSGTFIYPTESFVIDIESDFVKSDGESWITVGSAYMPNFPIPKLQSTMAITEENPSADDERSYYILGGTNAEFTSLDILEKIETFPDIFSYSSSYDSNVSVALSGLPVPKHGAGSAMCTAWPGSDDYASYIYIIGGYTTAKDSSYVNIGFDI
jgi:hypothetical protein